MAEPKEVVITESSHCNEVVSVLSHESLLAVNCQIIEQGFHGRLTLVQVGTSRGDVYLFDIQENKELITEGGLHSLMESAEILKVMKGCKDYSYKLYRQFNVTLQNVFDVEIADNVIEAHKGRRIFQRLTIQDLCEKYSTYGSLSAECIDEFKAFQMKTKRWGKRPLSTKMVVYAANYVRVLIPELYEEQNRLIEKNNLSKIHLERITRMLYSCKDDDLNEKRKKKRKDCIWQVINSINENWDRSTKHSDFVEEGEEMLALRRITYWEVQKSPFIERLKTESIMSYLNKLDNEIVKEGDDFCVTTYIWTFLSKNQSHPNENVSKQVKDLQEKMKEITLNRMEKTYSMTCTNLEEMATTELWIVGSLFLKSTGDPQFSSVIARLFWLVMEKKLDDKRELLEKFGERCKLDKSFYEKLSFYADHTNEPRIPRSVHQKSRSLKQQYDRATGRGGMFYRRK